MLGMVYLIDGPVESDQTTATKARIDECIANPPRPEPPPCLRRRSWWPPRPHRRPLPC